MLDVGDIMSKAKYIRAFSNTDQNRCLEAAEKILAKVPELSPKNFYFPEMPNENGYFSVLIRVPQELSELRLKAKVSWALA